MDDEDIATLDIDERIVTAKEEVEKARLEVQMKEAKKFTNREFIKRIDHLLKKGKFNS